MIASCITFLPELSRRDFREHAPRSPLREELSAWRLYNRQGELLWRRPGRHFITLRPG